MAERGRGDDMTPSRSQVVGQDWEGRAIGRDDAFDGIEFVDCDLTEIENAGATFTRCLFRNVKFNASRHRDGAFVNCTFQRCNFFDVMFEGCKLVGSIFEGCTWDIVKIEGGDWSFVTLAKAEMPSATLTAVRMREVDLTGARFGGATLRDLDLSGAILNGVDFSGTDLRGSDLTALDPATAMLRSAIITAVQAITVAESLGLDVRPE